MDGGRALVLARGLGRRMRAEDPSATLAADQSHAAAAGAKPMMPVGARPFLDYVLASLADAGCRRVAIVVGPEHDEVRARYSEPGQDARLEVAFVIQPKPEGTADAVRCAESWADGEPFVVVNGDNLYPVDALRALALLETPGLLVFTPRELVDAGNIPANRIAAFALCRIDADGWLRAIVEKPDASAWARAGGQARVSMNAWRFDARIFEACRDVRPSPRGELELPAAVSLAIARGVRFRAVGAHGSVLDLSTRADVAEVERRLGGRRGAP